jgi:DNA-binding CsgD family transcriptional regulator/tetratricopeptide (TPR) repeat protein
MYSGDRQDASLGVFVGRQREMGELKVALEDVLSGHGRLVMLVGEPGIGKTRTARELAAIAEQRGARVLWGWCYEEEGAPPYWPWVQPIRSYFQQRDPEQLRSEMGPGAADIAEVIPELKERLPDLKPPPALAPEEARFRLFDSITTFLKNAAQSQPMMLVLDDLHWADKPSLLLLQFLVRQLGGSRLLVMGCYRDVELSRQHPLSEALAQLSREPVFQRKPLRGLSQADTGRFIEVTAGTEPPSSLVETIYGHTEGNPFFMTEVIRLLAERGELSSEEIGGPQGIRIPEGVREVIGQRLNRLSEQCNQTLATASIIGREFDFKLLKALSSGVTEERLLEVIDEALEAHLVEEVPGGIDRYQFSHALIQQTLAEELSTSRRVRLHARIAEALEALYGADVEAHAAELAHHFAEAHTVLGTEKLVRYSLLAGEQALAAYAWEDAQARFQRALAAKEGQSPVGAGLQGLSRDEIALPWGSQGAASSAPTGPVKDAETAALLFGLGRAQLATLERHQIREVVATLSRAFDYYAAAGDVAGALAVAQYPIMVAGTIGRTGVAGFIPRALKLVPPDSLAAGRLLCSYGAELGQLEGDYENAQAAFAQALAIARREGDLALEVRTLAAAASVDLFHLRFQEGLEEARRAIALAGRLGDQQAAWRAHLDAARILIYTGEVGVAQQHAAAALELAERLRGRYQLELSFRYNATLLRLQGDWQGARELSDRGLAVAPQEVTLLGDRVLLEYDVGDFGQGEAYLERFLATMPPAAARPGIQYALPAVTIPVVSRITGVLDRLDIAAAAAQTVVSSPFANPLYAMLARAGLGLLAVLRDDAAAAAQQYGPLQSQAGTMYPQISIDRLLGLLAQTMGNLDKASEHFEDALAFCRKAGYRPELAWTCCDYADALLLNPVGAHSRAPLPADRQKAMSLLDEALAITRELGMRPLMERVVALQEKVESPPAKAPAYPDSLTQREVEVLRLVAAGKTDRQIAEELFISVTTASTHVRNLLNKTNTANRTEAAAYAAQHGLN